jgi:hypothetical protein
MKDSLRWNLSKQQSSVGMLSQLSFGSITSLIPSLDGCSNGIKDDGKIEHLRVRPSPSPLDEQSLAVGIVQFGNAVDLGWVLSYQGAFLKKW